MKLGSRIQGVGRLSTVAMLLAALTMTAACAPTRMEFFLDGYHRRDLSLQPEELHKLQFYTSRDILVQHKGENGEQSIFLPAHTPGVVVAEGPDWMELSFRKGGANIPFIVDQRSEHHNYTLATRLPGESGFEAIKNMQDPKFYVGSDGFVVLQGATARLLAKSSALEKLTKERIVTGGRKVPAK